MNHLKKIVTVILVTGVCICLKASTVMAADVTINRKNFPDEALRAEVSAFDTDRDGKLQKEEIRNVKSLHVYKFLDSDDVDYEENPDAVMPQYQKSDFVFDFKGVEYFTGLNELTINLSGGCVQETGKHYASEISNFKKVYQLKKLTSLTMFSAKVKQINLSKFPKLKKCSLDLPGLCSITVNNKELHNFRLSDTANIKKLDFSSAPKLKVLYLSQMKAPYVVFGRNNKKLKELHVESNGKTKISSLDITPLASLERFTLTKVRISNINFSKNKALDDVYVDNCSIKKLDFTKNTKLTWLACEGKKTKKILIPKKNRISTFKWVNAGLTRFSNKRLNPKTLTSVILFGNRISSLNLERYKKLDYVSVDKNVKVKLAQGLSDEGIISYL